MERQRLGREELEEGSGMEWERYIAHLREWLKREKDPVCGNSKLGMSIGEEDRPP